MIFLAGLCCSGRAGVKDVSGRGDGTSKAVERGLLMAKHIGSKGGKSEKCWREAGKMDELRPGH